MSDRTEKKVWPPNSPKCNCFQIWDRGLGKSDRSKSATFLDKYPWTRPYVVLILNLWMLILNLWVLILNFGVPILNLLGAYLELVGAYPELVGCLS